jgi:hypothetical protein
MRRRAAILILLPLLAACGNSQPSHSGEYGTEMASTPDVSHDDLMAGMTLDVTDLGGAWTADDAGTHPVSVDEAMQHQSLTVQDRDLRSYWNGYQTRSTSGGTSLVSTVWIYRNSEDSFMIAAELENLYRHLGGKPASHAPGNFFVLTRRGSGSKRSVTATWAHDNVVSTAVLAGSGATVSRLTTLARRQDRKVAENLDAALAASAAH